MCEVPRQSGESTQIPSLTCYEPKTIETNSIEIELKDLELRRIELDRNLGTDPYQIQERFMRNNYQNPITEDMDEIGKVGAETSYFQSQMHSHHDSAEALQTRILKMENYEKCWLHHYFCKVEKTESSRIFTASSTIEREVSAQHKKKKPEANNRAYDINQKTVQALDTLAEECGVFEVTMKTVTFEHEEGDVLYAVASEVAEELDLALPKKNRFACKMNWSAPAKIWLLLARSSRTAGPPISNAKPQRPKRI